MTDPMPTKAIRRLMRATLSPGARREADRSEARARGRLTGLLLRGVIERGAGDTPAEARFRAAVAEAIRELRPPA